MIFHQHLQFFVIATEIFKDIVVKDGDKLFLVFKFDAIFNIESRGYIFGQTLLRRLKQIRVEPRTRVHRLTGVPARR